MSSVICTLKILAALPKTVNFSNVGRGKRPDAKGASLTMVNKCLIQGAKKVSFTACHLGKL